MMGAGMQVVGRIDLKLLQHLLKYSLEQQRSRLLGLDAGRQDTVTGLPVMEAREACDRALEKCFPTDPALQPNLQTLDDWEAFARKQTAYSRSVQRVGAMISKTVEWVKHDPVYGGIIELAQTKARLTALPFKDLQKAVFSGDGLRVAMLKGKKEIHVRNLDDLDDSTNVIPVVDNVTGMRFGGNMLVHTSLKMIRKRKLDGGDLEPELVPMPGKRIIQSLELDQDYRSAVILGCDDGAIMDNIPIPNAFPSWFQKKIINSPITDLALIKSRDDLILAENNGRLISVNANGYEVNVQTQLVDQGESIRSVNGVGGGSCIAVGTDKRLLFVNPKDLSVYTHTTIGAQDGEVMAAAGCLNHLSILTATPTKVRIYQFGK